MADCGFDPVCWAGEQIAKTASPLIWKQLEDWMARGAASAVRLSVSGWINVPTPDVTSANGGVAYLTAYTRPITYVVFAVALMFQAAQLAWSQRGEDVREMARGLLQFVVISGGGVAVVALLTEAGNGFATWILTASTDGTTGATMGDRIITLLGITAGGNIVQLPIEGPVVALLCFVVSLAGIIQVLLIYARAIVLVLLSGLLPVAAAAAMTRRGRSILDRYLAWMLAWLLYKPVAASIYAGAFFMMGTGGALSFVGGLGAIVMAVFALPALMRLINPMVAGMGGGGAGLAGAAAMAGPVAEGAVRMGGSMGSAGTADAPSGGGAVRDATYGSRPSGSAPAGGSGPTAGTSGSPGGGPAGASGGGPAAAGSGATPAATGSGAGASAGAGAGAGAGGAATGAAGGASAGAAGGPVGMAVVAGAEAGRKVAGAAAQAARQTTNEATGAGGGQP
jgi:hypothetical protein